MTVVSATLEVGLLEFGVSRPIWATQWKLMSKKKERQREGGGKGTVQLVMVHKHEDLNSDPQNPQR